MWRFNKITKFIIQSRNLTSKQVFNNLNVSEEVRFALDTGKAIVALESTIITHGMPYRNNLQCALEVEQVVRDQGAVPATIAILRGKVTVGLSEDQISELADVVKTKSVKTSRRDFPYVLSQKLNGGTTVSGTIIVANKVGIPVFVTGGVGGVHRQGENTLDISADLTELGRNSVAVVSSGIKSILDIPRTLEYLETQGVFVATIGDSDDFPAFYCRTSGCQVPSVRTPLQAAQVIHSSLKIDLGSGMLFGVPIPEEHSLDPKAIQHVIDRALIEANKLEITGKNVTPFLLKHIAEITEGRTLKANVALIKNNAKVGAQIAMELQRLRGANGRKEEEDEEKSLKLASPVVIGGCVLDRCASLKDSEMKLDGSMHYGKFSVSAGGVGRNICEALGKLGTMPVLLSAVGGDNYGQQILSQLPTNSVRHVKRICNASTAQCTVVLDSNGECKLLIGEMDIFNEITPDMIRSQEELLKRSPLLVADGNLPLETLCAVLELAEKHHKPVFYEPTDIPVSVNPFRTPYWKSVKYISPNLNELRTIAEELGISKQTKNSSDPIAEACVLGKLVSEYIDTIFITLGPLGLMIVRKANADTPLVVPSTKTKNVQIRLYKTNEIKKLVNVSGAGDCLASGIISAMLMGKSEATCVSVGFAAAQMSLQSCSAVPKVMFGLQHNSWKEKATYIQL